jgi:hypothetical protein
MWVYAPNEHANGIYATVRFIEGVGMTDDPKLIEWFKNNGYRVEEGDYPVKKKEEDKKPSKKAKADEKAVEEPKVEEQEEEVPMMDVEETVYGIPLTKVLLMNDADLKAFAVEHGLGKKVRAIKHREALLKALGVEI